VNAQGEALIPTVIDFLRRQGIADGSLAVEHLLAERDRLREALRDVLGMAWPTEPWEPHDANDGCDEFCALMRTLTEADALLNPSDAKDSS